MRIRRPWTLLAAAGVLAFLALKLTASAWSAALPACTFQRLTGLYCPGCGGTRCAKSLLRGDVATAFGMNAAVAGLSVVACGLLGFAVLREWKGKPDAMPLLPGWFAWCLAGSVVVFALVRNLPWWPFTLLVPH
jgi:hypothetical protein